MESRINVVHNRLKAIKQIILVASGKGGVGKSFVATALALSLSNKKHSVGLFDLDFYGPSSHIILGVKNIFPEEEKGILPPVVNGIHFMSIVFFTNDKPAPFRGVDISNIIIELFTITRWGALDYLIIDMPPGIGDETLDVIRLVKKGKFLVITTPSRVALAGVSKLLSILKELHIPIVGVIENMTMNSSDFIRNNIFKMKIPYLGSISYDQNLEDSIGKPRDILNTDFMQDLNKVLGALQL